MPRPLFVRPDSPWYDEEVERHWSAGNHVDGGPGVALIERRRPDDGNVTPAGVPCPRCIGGRVVGGSCLNCGCEG